MEIILGIIVVLGILSAIGSTKLKKGGGRGQSTGKRQRRATKAKVAGKRDIVIAERKPVEGMVSSEEDPDIVAHIEAERFHRKHATELKRQKRYLEAVEELKIARGEDIAAGGFTPINTLVRVPKYLILAGRYQEAVEECEKIVAGECYPPNTVLQPSQIKEHCSIAYSVASEAAEEAGDYETAAECMKLSDEYYRESRRLQLEKQVQDITAHGADIAKIDDSQCDCEKCQKWSGRIISISGKDKAFPPLSAALADGVFGVNCFHSLFPLDELIHKNEIQLQRSFPLTSYTDEEMERNTWQIDVARKMMGGLSERDAIIAVDRDRLEFAIRAGLLAENSQEIADSFTEEQLKSIVKNGRPPEFVLAKKGDTPGIYGNRIIMDKDDISLKSIIRTANL